MGERLVACNRYDQSDEAYNLFRMTGEWPEEERIDVIGQNGNNADIYHHNHKHGHAVGDKPSPTYRSWRGMKDRCYNSKNAKFYRYGARGITVCDAWRDEVDGFKNFLSDMGEKPEGCSLDRIDNDGDYEPTNCRWTDATTQARNTSKNVLLEYEGEERCLSEWVEISGIPRTTFYRRYYVEGKRGDALFSPTIHMQKEALFERMEKFYEKEGKINFTAMAEVLGISRNKVSRIWKEFTEDNEDGE